MTSRPKHIAGFDALRFVAASIVALGHFTYDYGALIAPIVGSQAGKLFDSAMGVAFNGPAAVVVFFVLSGFVIHWPNVGRDKLEVLPFYARRFIRIIPPAGVFVAAWLIFRGNPGDWNQTVLWSLLCEAVYYAAYPALRLIGVGRAFVVSALVVAGMLIFALPSNPDYVAYGNWTWLLGLPIWLAGCMAAEHWDRLPTLTLRGIWALRVTVYALSVAALIARFHLGGSYPVLLTLFAIPVALWIGIEARVEKRAGWLDIAGLASYSLYLVHPLLLWPWASNPAIYLACVAIGTAALYLLVERPSHWLARWVGRRISKAPTTPVANVGPSYG